MRAIHEMSDGTYGAPRIQAKLADVDGRIVNLKRIARLMREAGIAGVSHRKFCVTTVRDSAARPAADLVERNFAASGPNQLWVADITYIPTWIGFLYLAVVIDVWSRKVVGWSMATHLKTEARGRRSRRRRGATAAAERGASLRSRHAIQLDSLRAAMSPGRRPALDGIHRRRLRQRPV
jgi:transposase InsO family protein